MCTPEELPNPEDALARAHAARAKMAAALDEDQEPEPGEPMGWQPVWKRPRKPKSKAATPGRRTSPPCRRAVAPAPVPAEPDR